MISINSVITLQNGFVTIDKLNTNQFINVYEQHYSWLNSINFNLCKGILIETKYFDIVVSENQKFLSYDGSPVKAKNLCLSDTIKTVSGFDFITKLELLEDFVEMASLKTDSGLFTANGFILLGS